MSVLTLLARLSPRERTPEGLTGTGVFLDGEADPSTIAAAADGVGILVGIAAVAVALLAGTPSLLVVAVGLGLGAVVVARSVPRAIVNARRSRAFGEAPALVGRAVLRVRVSPTAEGAAEFAAGSDELLAENLGKHVRRARGTPHSGLGRFAESWRERFPALHRAVLLVEAAADAPTNERDRALDRALGAILEGTRARTADAADAMQGPATALYAFGVLLPLALVAVLPAASAAGLDATLPIIVAVYDLLLPAGLAVAVVWLLGKRPAAFPPAPVGRDHPDVPNRRWPSLAVGSLVAALAWIGSGALLSAWSRPLAAIGFGTGTVLLAQYRPIVAVRRRVDALEGALPDALYLVGRRVADGIAVERAIVNVTEELDGPIRDAFEDAARRGRQLRIGVGAAFGGEGGALEPFPSPRAESAAELLDVAAHEGPPAGRALVETADHLDDLRRVERETRRELGRVTATLGNTAAVFGPLVGGATVALADGVGTANALEGTTPPTPALALAVGVYILLMAVALTALSVGLSRGLDRATVGYRVGGALVSATATYLIAFAAAGALAGGL